MPADLRDTLQASLGAAYALERELGGGGMSRVFVAEETALGRTVVVKVLPPELSGAVSAERFRQEVRLAARLHHPHVVPLLAAGEAGGVLYYTMPLVEGESLRARLTREGELPVADAVRCLRDVADALCYAHGHGVVHRDLKPENVLVSGRHALVTDFGVAKALSAAAGAEESLTSAGVALGTPAYMAPEQAAADPHVDHRADLYALGCVAYELLAGAPPFANRPPQQTLAAQVSEAAEPIARRRPGVPPALGSLVMRCLEKRPADRPQSAEVVLREFETITSGSGATTVSHSGRVTARRRALAVGIAATVLALGGAAVAVRARRTFVTPDASARPPTAAARPLDPKRVAVAPFENRTGDPTLDPVGRMAADWVTRGLTQTGLVDVVDAAALYAQGNAAGVASDPRAFAARNGAGTLVSGGYYRSADSLYFEAAVRDAHTGEVRRALEPVASPAGAPVRGVEALRRRVMAGLASVLDVRASAFMVPASEPPTFEAYRAFVAGQDAQWRDGDRRGAMRHYAEAFRLDSTFYLAAWGLTAAAGDAEECAVVDSVARALAPRRPQIDAFVQISTDINPLRCRGDWEGVYRLQRQRAALFPRSAFVRYQTGLWATAAGRPREALAALRQLDPDRELGWLDADRAGYWRRLTSAYHALGDHAGELAAAREFARRAPRRLGAVALEARALAALGRDSAALARLDDAMRLPADLAVVFAAPLFGGAAGPGPVAGARPLYLATAGWVCYATARELVAHGRAEAAGAAAARAVAWFRARPADERAAPEARFGLAGSLALVGQLDEAAALLRALAAADRANVHYRGGLGVFAARSGDRAGAARTDEWLSTSRGPYLRGVPALYRAEMAAVRGERARALALLQEAVAQGADPFSFWVHAEPAFASLRGDPAFEALFRPRD